MHKGTTQVGTSEAAAVDGALTQPVSADTAIAATVRVQPDDLERCFMRLRLGRSSGGRRHPGQGEDVANKGGDTRHPAPR